MAQPKCPKCGLFTYDEDGKPCPIKDGGFCYSCEQKRES